MRETFVHKKFRAESTDIIRKANIIIRDYQEQGLMLTLRQLYYRFVSKGFIANKQSEYDRLGAIISSARLAGLIDWDAIEDRTRFLRTTPAWATPTAIVDACASQYKENLWATQDIYPEVWIEKDALVGVVERPCNEFRVPYFACRGYASQSAQYEAGKRIERQRLSGKTPIILHFGDHDPSGIDMTRDNEDRLSMFAKMGVEVKRIALNMDQIEEYDPPPNPAKESDSRFGVYRERFGDDSWELDALEPSVIDQLIRDEFEQLIDKDAWEVAEAKEGAGRKALTGIVSNWNYVQHHLKDKET